MQIGNFLKSRLLAASIGFALLAGGCATVDTSKDWIDIKDPGELKAMYSNKTLKGTIPWFDQFVPYVLYSRADGSGTFHFQSRQSPMTWEVKGEDQVCTKRPGASNCFRYQRHATRAGVYRGFNLSTKSYGNEITIEDGVPKS